MLRSSSSLTLAAMVVLAGCQGLIGDPSGTDDGADGADGDGPGDDDGSEQELPDDVVAEPLHRLNRLEYDNTVRDLLGTTLTPADAFPPDNVTDGFDNAADGLTLTPSLMDLYATAARDLARATLETAPRFTVRIGAREHAIATGQPGNAFDWGWSVARFGGSIGFTVDVPQDEETTVSILAGGDAYGMPAPEMGLVVDGVEVQRWVVTSTPTAPVVHSAQVPLAAGSHAVAVSFPNGADQPADNVFNSLVVGYLDVTSAATVTPAGRALVYVCEPSEVADPVGCHRAIVTRLAERAWRRPLTEDEEEELFGLWQELRATEGDEAAVSLTLRAILMSSKFLYRASFPAPSGSSGDEVLVPLDDHVLASRLSYFVWSSMPDQELLDRAAAGELRDPEVLRRQVGRMLADPRAAGLRRGFASQWLSTRTLQQFAPDPATFPAFDEPLRAAMTEEAELFFEDFLTNGYPLGEMMSPDFGWLNDRLAQHYGLPLPGSEELVRVDLEGEERRGLLMQGAWLTATSAPNRTSPVVRGRWILEQVLCTSIPPPPPDVPLFMEPAEGETARELLAQHREDPICAGCHDLLDPAGLGMEGFDGIGAVRDTENGRPVDTSGAIPPGVEFDGAAELSELLASDPRFVECLTHKLFTYAMGRARVSEDDEFVDVITGELAAEGDSLESLVELIVSSPAFRMRRAEEGGE